MGVVLRNTSGTTYLHDVTIDIIDKDHSGDAPADFSISETASVTITQLGDKANVFDVIIPTNAKCNVILNVENMWFFEDMLASEEGRYFLRITRDVTVEFFGKIMVENMSLDDRHEPVFSFTAIDCLTDLKNKDFNLGVAYPFVRDVITYCLMQMDTSFTFSGSVALWAFQSDIIPNVGMYDDDLMDIVFTSDYFYTEENEEKTVMKCWDVLYEVLQRLNCQIFYEADVFWIFGMEGIFRNRVKPVHFYNYLGNYVSSDATTYVSKPLLDITDEVLVGGKYYFKAGHKEVRIEADKKFSNRKIGDAIYSTTSYPFALVGSYQSLGFVKASQSYKMVFNHEVKSIEALDDTIAVPFDFRIRINVREINLETGTTTMILTDQDYVYPLQISRYVREYNLQAAAYDRLIEVKYELITFDEPNNLVIVNILNYTSISETKQIYDKIVVKSILTGSRNVAVKTIKLYGNDYNGSESVKFYFHDGDLFQIRQETREWKLAGDADWRGLEQIITETQLQYLGNQMTLEVSHNNKNDLVVNRKKRITYGVDTFSILAYEKILHRDVINLKLLKVNGVQDGDIVTTQEIPLASDITAGVSSITGNIILNEKRPVRIYERTFTGNSYSITAYTDWDADYTYISVVQSVLVYVNGNKQYLKSSSTMSAIHQNEIYINPGTGVITFPISYTNAKLEIFIYNFFIKGVTA